jgi:hypothetical protein
VDDGVSEAGKVAGVGVRGQLDGEGGEAGVADWGAGCGEACTYALGEISGVGWGEVGEMEDEAVDCDVR